MQADPFHYMRRQLSVLSKLCRSDRLVIAGGAVRDYLNDKPINDLDVFVPYSTAEHGSLFAVKASNKRLYPFTILGEIEALYRLKAKRISPSADYTHWSGISIRWIFELATKPIKTQIIVYDTRHPFDIYLGLLPTFDFGLNMVAYDGKDIIKTDEYIRDSTNKTLTLNSRYTLDHRMQNRLNRLLKKYPDFKFEPGTPQEPSPLTINSYINPQQSGPYVRVFRQHLDDVLRVRTQTDGDDYVEDF